MALIKRAGSVAGEKIQDSTKNNKVEANSATNSIDFSSNGSLNLTLNSSGDLVSSNDIIATNIIGREGSSGATANALLNNVVAESAGSAGMSVLSGNTAFGYYGFGDAEDNYIGGLQYDHSNNTLGINVNNITALSMTPAVATFNLTTGMIINGSLKLNDNDPFNDPLSITNTTGGNSFNIKVGTGLTDLRTSGAQSIALSTDNIERLRIDPTGKTIIKSNALTAAIAESLSIEVPDTVGNRGGLITRVAGGGPIGGLVGQIVTGGAFPNSVGRLDIVVQNEGSTTTAATFDAAGNVGIGINPTGVSLLQLAGSVGTTNGTAALPTHTFYSDNDTGMYRVAVDVLGFSAGGNESFRVTNGSVRVNANVAGVSPNLAMDELVVESSGSGGINILTGSTTATTFVGFGDPDDSYIGGINYNHSNDSLNLVANNNTYMKIDSAGNVGIGTDTPTAKLHIDTGGIASTGIRLEAGAVFDAIVGIGNGGNKYFQLGEVGATDPGRFSLFDNGIEQVRLDSAGNSYLLTGNLAIGRTDPNGIIFSVSKEADISSQALNAIPTVNIQNTVSSYTAGNIIGSIGWTKINSYANGHRAGIFALYSSTGSQSANIGTELIFKTAVEAAGDSLERLRIDSVGNVGVGTATPIFSNGSGLHIARPATASLRVERLTANTKGLIELFDGNDILGIYGAGAKPMTFWTNANERMRINSVGNVGIGTASPATNAQTTIRTTDTYFTTNTATITTANTAGPSIAFQNLSSSGTGAIASVGYGTGVAIDRGYLTFSTAAASNILTERMRIDSAGNVGIGTTPSSAFRLDVLASGTSRGIIRVKGGNTDVTAVGEISSALYFGSNDPSVNNSNNTNGIIQMISENTNGADWGMAFSTYDQSNGGLNEYLRITNTGRAGFGTSTPSAPVHINNTTDTFLLRLTGGIDNRIDMFNDGTRYTQIQSTALASSFRAIGSNTKLILGANGANSIVCDTNGNVGIGTNTPESLLDIVGLNSITLGSNRTNNVGKTSIIGQKHKFNAEEDILIVSAESRDFENEIKIGGGVSNKNTTNIISLHTAPSNTTTLEGFERVRVTDNGSVGVGTNSPNINALVDLTSTDRGLLLTRLTTTQRDSMSSPPDGIIIYNTTTNRFQGRQSGAWVNL